jgi:hypothetical protein
MRVFTVLALAALLAACSAEQVQRSAASACRANPNNCTEPGAIPATRSPGL